MKRYFILITALLAALPAFGQKLDPTVSVSRDYKGSLKADKPQLSMFVPDSVMHFDISYDYSVFKTQYKGAYEFNPYLLDMKPTPDAFTGRKFYLKAGAGYAMHPSLDAVWTPQVGVDGLSVSLFATHRSYFGKYRALYGHEAFNGYDMANIAGANVRKDWKTGFFSAGAVYDGIHVQDCRGFNSGRLSLRAASKPHEGPYFLYDVAVDGSFGGDKVIQRSADVKQAEIVMDATFGQVFAKGKALLADLDVDYVNYSGYIESYASDIALTPKFVLSGDRFNLQLGARLSVLMATEGEHAINNATRGQFIYPAVKADYMLVRDAFDVYADIGGGDRLNTYSSLSHMNHRFNPAYQASCNILAEVHPAAGIMDIPLLDNSVERVNAAVGLRGNISRRFGYDVSAGFISYANTPVFAISEAKLGNTSLLAPVICYQAYASAYASARLSYRTSDVDIEGGVKYTRSNLYSHNKAGFEPTPLLADLSLTYNWNRRVFAGVSAVYGGERKSWCLSCNSDGNGLVSGNIPYFVDLGVNLEYRISRKFSVWVEGCNLLNMEIQRIPMYAESGIWITGGICINL